MARTLGVIGCVCAAVASLLFAALASTFDPAERGWRPVMAFAGYLLVVPVVLMCNSKAPAAANTGTYIVVGVLATAFNALAVFVALCDGSVTKYTTASPPHSRQVLDLTGVSALLFVIADLFLVAAAARGEEDGLTGDTRYRDEDGVSAGETQALLGDFGGVPVPTMKGLNPAASAAAVGMTEALRAYDAGSDVTPEEITGRSPPSVDVTQGNSPPPQMPASADAHDGGSAPRAVNLFGPGASSGDVPPLATVPHAARAAHEDDDPKAASVLSDHDRYASTRENIDSDEIAEIELAATHYDESYRELMLKMSAPSDTDNAQPFIGFSLTDNVKEGCLVVDGIFEAGPAYQVGVDVDHELVSIAGYPVTYMEDVGPLIRKYCNVGHVTVFVLRNVKGETFEAPVWVMTAEERYAGKNFYFDRGAHTIRQSDRLKSTWRPSADRHRSVSIADDEL